MRKSIPVVFKQSLLAATVVSVTACSSMPQMSNVDFGPVGEGFAKAGKATANVGRKTWNSTAYYLGFRNSRDEADQSPSDDQLLIASNDATGSAEGVPALQVAPLDENRLPDNPLLVEHSSSEPKLMAANGEPQLVDANAQQTASNTPSEQDLIYEVAADENLWDISKKTTGDATNWHTLADINNLAQNAAVFPGQQLLIPSNMVKPNYDSDNAATVSADASDVEQASDTDDAVLVDNTQEAADATATQVVLAAASDTQDAVSDAVSIDLQEGETLWDFSKRTTGNATNWQQIASQNNFTESQATKVRPGQSIQVPTSLLKDSLDATAAAPAAIVIEAEADSTDVAQGAAQATDTLAENAQATLAAALPAASGLKEQVAEGADQLLEKGSDMVDGAKQTLTISKPEFAATESLNTENLESEAAQIAENANIPGAVTVKGTYYPKAVYNDADFSSSLLMRVSPGTQLQVSRAMGTWFEVETEKGVGYVHARDIQ